MTGVFNWNWHGFLENFFWREVTLGSFESSKVLLVKIDDGKLQKSCSIDP